jgi:hypothetical protein
MTALHATWQATMVDRPHSEGESLEAEVARLTAAYEQTLTIAISESGEGRAARAFDTADRLQNQILLTSQRLRRLAPAAS